MLPKWRQYFVNHIVERGYDLYYHHQVKLLKEKQDCFDFLVKNHYQITIILKDSQIVQAKCDCPQGKKEIPCKHLAACFIYLENQDSKDMTLNLDHLLQQLSNQDKDDLLYQALLQDEKILLSALTKYPDMELTLSYQLNQIFLDYGFGKDDDITFEQHLLDFIQQLSLENLDDEEIFQHLKHLLLRLQNFKNEESYINYIGIENEALELLEKLLKDFKMEAKVFAFLTQYPLEDSYLDFIFDHFRQKSYATKKIDLINHCLSRIKSYDAWAKDYYLEFYQLKRLMVYYDMQDQSAVLQLTQQYWHYPKIREFWIEEAKAKKDYCRALEILQESLEMDCHEQGLQLKYQRMMTDIYEIMGDPSYQRSLKKLLFVLDPGDFDDYLRYKSLFNPEDWVIEREALFQVEMEEIRLFEILRSEKCYDRLLPQLVDSLNLYYLGRHSKEFQKCCPELLTLSYVQLIYRISKNAQQKKQYQMIVMLLTQLAKIDEKMALKTSQELLRLYPRKKTLKNLLIQLFDS